MANHLDQMRVFTAIVETGGFTRATERMGMSRAAISRLVKARSFEAGFVIWRS